MTRILVIGLILFLGWAMVTSRVRGLNRWNSVPMPTQKRALRWLFRARQQWQLEYPEKSRELASARRHCDVIPLIVGGIGAFGVVAGRWSYWTALAVMAATLVYATWRRLQLVRQELSWFEREKSWSADREIFSSAEEESAHWSAVEAQVWMAMLPALLRVLLEGRGENLD